MSRLPARVLATSLLLAGVALAACAEPTAPRPVAKSSLRTSPSHGAIYDEIIQPDSTCRSGFSVGNAHTCI